MTREEAIKILEQFKKCLADVVFDEKGSEAWQMAIKALSQETCEDAISRKNIGLTDFEIVMCNGDYKQALEMLIEKIQKAPSVTPKSETVTEFADRCRECGAKYGKYRKEAKRWKNKWLQSQKSGKWIAHSDGGIWIKYYECSECGRGHTIHSDYCPNCGAKMFEPQESEE